MDQRNSRRSLWSALVTGLLICSLEMWPTVGGATSCPQDKLQTCINMADKLLENDRFMFPTTKADVEDTCNSWSSVLECIEGYVAECLSEQQKAEFKQAVVTVLDSVRNLCTDPTYQEQYFQHAECIKRTCTDDAYCGRYYKKMTRQVSQDFDTSDLCCFYHKFDGCVVDNTNAICGSTARDFASAMLNKSMSFLGTRCQGVSDTPECTELNDVAVARPSYSVIDAVTPSSRALPEAPTAPTTRWSVTHGPESLAYENAASVVAAPSTLICFLFVLFCGLLSGSS